MVPQFVKPYVKTSKNDAADAEAICEAVTRPNIRFVLIKHVDQQAVLTLHRVRQALVKARTAQGNNIPFRTVAKGHKKTRMYECNLCLRVIMARSFFRHLDISIAPPSSKPMLSTILLFPAITEIDTVSAVPLSGAVSIVSSPPKTVMLSLIPIRPKEFAFHLQSGKMSTPLSVIRIVSRPSA